MPGLIKLSSTPVIIISRTDNIGDVVLTLSLAGILKKKYPGASILFLGKKYIRPLIEACEHISKFIDWDDVSALPMEDQLSLFKSLKADVILHVFPHPEVASLAYRAGIPYRIGTSHRSYHWLYCNKRPNFTRKKSDLHEAQLNVKLAAPLGIATIPSLDELKTAYGLSHLPQLKDTSLIDKNKFNLILHPKSRGSAREWDWKNWSKLVEILPADKFKLFVTGTESEGIEIRKNLLANHPEVNDLTGKLDFSQLIAFISQADGLVAASTGPLHIAAALGKTAIGLYPSIRPMHPGRWAPLGPKASYLALDKDCTACKKNTSCLCINTITPEQVKALLSIK
ncbi:MAG TPA: glycosyltransferase family 9 protein [Bacteroidia bacterium]|jgi:heptosyltransferase-3|nr:glycosyltransferase family 9 protein [Bacteroidia bacterium]